MQVACVCVCARCEWAHLLSLYVQFVYTLIHSILGKEISIETVIYGVHVRFWPTLILCSGMHFACCLECACYLCFFMITQKDVCHTHMNIRTCMCKHTNTYDECSDINK